MTKTRLFKDPGLAGRWSRAVIGGTILIGLLAGTAATSFLLVIGHFEPSISDLTAGRDQVDQIGRGMVDEETGLRAYLSTQDTTFLQPYTTGRQEIAVGETGSIALAARVELTEPMIDLRLAERAWLTQWAAPALTVEHRALTPVQQAAFLLSGKTLLDAYRATQVVVDRRVSADLSAEQATEHNVLAMGAGLGAIAILATAAAVWRRHLAVKADSIEGAALPLAAEGAGSSDDLVAPAVQIGATDLPDAPADVSQLTDTLLAERALFAELETHSGAQAARLQLIVAVGQEIAGSLSLPYVSEAVAQAAVAITGYTVARIWLMADDQQSLTAIHDSGVEHGARVERDSVTLGEGLVGRAGQHGRVFSSHLDGSVAAGNRSDMPTGGVAVPMIVAARVVGVLELSTDASLSIDEETLEIIRSLAGQAATAVEAARLHQRDDEISHTDVLTDLPNRRRLETDLDAEVARSLRYQRPLAFIMLDVDHFKDFNDTNGHQVGDEILAEFGHAFADVLRETDTAYRYGGEEFCVLLRETDAAAAAAVADRLRMSIEARFAGSNGSRPVTASLGVAAMPDDANDARSLIAAADGAVYSAKAAGRNRVVPASHVLPGRVSRVQAVDTPK